MMKRTISSVRLLLPLLLLTGCQNFWNTSTSTCTTNCSTITSGNFYVLNSNVNQVEIAGYSIVAGKLTALSGSPYNAPSGPYSIAMARNGKFLYVSGQAGIYLYTVGTDGALTLASTTPIFSDFAAYTMQVDATNSWLVEASGSGYVYALSVDPASGASTGSVQRVAIPGIVAHQLTLSRDNRNIFVALGGSGTAVIPFSDASADPLPSSVTALIAVKSAGGAAVSVAVDPTGRLFYVGELLATTSSSNTGGLRTFTYSSLSGTPAEVTGSPYATNGLSPVAILPSTDGSYVYVANSTVSSNTKGNIAEFAVTTTGSVYSLTPLSQLISAGLSPVALAEDSTDTVLLVVNGGGTPDLAAYTFDATTAGALDIAISAATGTDPVSAKAVVAAP